MEMHHRPKLDVLSVSDMCVDLILTGPVRPRFGQAEQLISSYTLDLGGSANIFATQVARLGGRSGLLGCVGRDSFGSLALERLQSLGVDVTYVRQRDRVTTGLGVNLVVGDDRAMLTFPGSIDSVEPNDLVKELLSAAKHWHLASYFLLTKLKHRWPSWLRELRTAGVTISFDSNWDPEECWDGALELLPLVDIFLPNAAEAQAITGRREVRDAARALAERCPLVVVKCGSQGALCCSQGEIHSFDAWPAPEPVVDAVGAGDCFDAGFVRAWQLGHSLSDCLRWALRCGATSLGEAGGIAGQLTEQIYTTLCARGLSARL
jgi:ribokinase